MNEWMSVRLFVCLAVCLYECISRGCSTNESRPQCVFSKNAQSAPFLAIFQVKCLSSIRFRSFRKRARRVNITAKARTWNANTLSFIAPVCPTMHQNQKETKREDMGINWYQHDFMTAVKKGKLLPQHLYVSMVSSLQQALWVGPPTYSK